MSSWVPHCPRHIFLKVISASSRPQLFDEWKSGPVVISSLLYSPALGRRYKIRQCVYATLQFYSKMLRPTICNSRTATITALCVLYAKKIYMQVLMKVWCNWFSRQLCWADLQKCSQKFLEGGQLQNIALESLRRRWGQENQSLKLCLVYYLGLVQGDIHGRMRQAHMSYR